MPRRSITVPRDTDRGPGRPGRRPEGDAPKTARIVLVCTGAEKAAVERAAAEAGVSLSKFVLGCAKRTRAFREAAQP